MPYSELIKNFEKIREYMKEFYVYGLKSRDDFDKKSGRTYDNEKRRIEGYLSEYMGFKQSKNGKSVFIIIDSRKNNENPLYKVWKTKSFTDSEITLHFILFDILYDSSVKKNLNEIINDIENNYLVDFDEPIHFDESTVRKKMKEYNELGLLESEKIGRQIYYSRTPNTDISQLEDVLHYYSEVALCGLPGSYILDKDNFENNVFSFKHHYLTPALESEVLCSLLQAIHEHREVKLDYKGKNSEKSIDFQLVPLKVFVSVGNGRRYLFAYSRYGKCIRSYRLDFMKNVRLDNINENFDLYCERLSSMKEHLWGVSVNNKRELEHVEFTVRVSDNEKYIVKRLEREKRCGSITKIDNNTYKFTANVYDSTEMIPWIRSFICRIISLEFSNKVIENTFKTDIQTMYDMYGIRGDCK